MQRDVGDVVCWIWCGSIAGSKERCSKVFNMNSQLKPGCLSAVKCQCAVAAAAAPAEQGLCKI